jgi:hypothetical protein
VFLLEITLVKPEITLVKPEITLVKPEITLVKPEITLVKPEIDLQNTEISCAHRRYRRYFFLYCLQSKIFDGWTVLTVVFINFYIKRYGAISVLIFSKVI